MPVDFSSPEYKALNDQLWEWGVDQVSNEVFLSLKWLETMPDPIAAMKKLIANNWEPCYSFRAVIAGKVHQEIGVDAIKCIRDFALAWPHYFDAEMHKEIEHNYYNLSEYADVD